MSCVLLAEDKDRRMLERFAKAKDDYRTWRCVYAEIIYEIIHEDFLVKKVENSLQIKLIKQNRDIN